jgi:ZIP family zinc transporter
MNDLLFLFLLTLGAGLAMPLGALVGRYGRRADSNEENEISHTVMAFGGGALLSAVALVLVPDGIEGLDPITASVCFLFGGLFFMGLDILFARSSTPASQLFAMLLDFIPESLALGAAFAIGNSSAFLLAGLIALQNIPEGFNAYRELSNSAHYRGRTIILSFTAMALFGPLSAVGGYYWFSDHQAILAMTVMTAAGGILYSVFQDIAPRVKLEKHWAPPMGAVLGFMLGMIGEMLLN